VRNVGYQQGRLVMCCDEKAEPEVIAEFKALYYRRLRGRACEINQHAAS
jgi:hypothetical protein